MPAFRPECLISCRSSHGPPPIHMDDYDIGFGRFGFLPVQVGSLYHKVHIKNQLGDRAQPFYQRRPDREVRHEIAVHHVDVKPVGARALD